LTNTYFKKSKKEEKQRILKRDMLKNLEDAKANNRHKKNKSEHFEKPNRRMLSMFNAGFTNAKQKTKNLKEEDFFEFNDSHRNEELQSS